MLNNNEKKQGSGCGSGILGTLLVIVGVVVFAVVSSLINSLFARICFSGQVACGLYPLSLIAVIVAFVAFEAAFIMWQIRGAKSSSRDTEEIKRITSLTRLVTVLAIIIPLLFSIVSANVYTKCSEKSISKVIFATTDEYRWDTRCDVLCYNLTIDSEGNAGFTVMMNDGEIIDLFANTNSVSDEFNGRFKNLWDYAAYLAKDMSESGYLIEGRISGVENLDKVKEISPDAYPYIKSIVDLNKNIGAQ